MLLEELETESGTLNLTPLDGINICPVWTNECLLETLSRLELVLETRCSRHSSRLVDRDLFISKRSGNCAMIGELKYFLMVDVAEYASSICRRFCRRRMMFVMMEG